LGLRLTQNGTNLHAVIVDRNIGRVRTAPGAAVEVTNAVQFDFQSLMRMAAEDAMGASPAGMGHRPHNQTAGEESGCGDIVELMSMKSKVPGTTELPHILLLRLQPQKAGHQRHQGAIVVAFHPYNFDASLPCRKLSQAGEKLPVGSSESMQVQITKDIAQQDQATKRSGAQQTYSVPRATSLGTQVQIRHDQRVHRL